MKITELPFVDLYLSGEGPSFATGSRLDKSPLKLDSSMCDGLNELYNECQKARLETGKEELTISFDDCSFRASLMKSRKGDVWVLRKFDQVLCGIDEIGVHSSLVNFMLTPKLTGMILIAGTYGQGKTTTATAILKSRLTKFGGIAVSIEDPIEMDLEGQHGDGQCYQVLASDGCFESTLRLAARWAPNIIYLGEIRDSATAIQALKTAVNGTLVITTIHGDSISGTIERLYALCLEHSSSTGDISSLISNGLSLVVTQSLLKSQNTVKPYNEFLWLKGNDNKTSGVKSLIRDKKWHQIQNEVDMQKKRFG